MKSERKTQPVKVLQKKLWKKTFFFLSLAGSLFIFSAQVAQSKPRTVLPDVKKERPKVYQKPGTFAASCKPSSGAGVVWDDKSFGSNLGQPRMHCSGRGNPAKQSIRLTTQPLDQGAGNARKMDQEGPLV